MVNSVELIAVVGLECPVPATPLMKNVTVPAFFTMARWNHWPVGKVQTSARVRASSYIRILFPYAYT